MRCDREAPLIVYFMSVVTFVVAAVLTPLDVHDAVRLLSKTVPVVTAVGTVGQLSGRYVWPAREFGGQLSGTELHLFPDGTYIHAQWADIEPLTIDDKGRWTLDNDVVHLTPDGTVTWQTNVERDWAAIRRRDRAREVLLISGRRLAVVVEHGKEPSTSPERQVAFMTMHLEEHYGPTKAREARTRLLTTAWRPDFVR